MRQGVETFRTQTGNMPAPMLHMCVLLCVLPTGGGRNKTFLACPSWKGDDDDHPSASLGSSSIPQAHPHRMALNPKGRASLLYKNFSLAARQLAGLPHRMDMAGETFISQNSGGRLDRQEAAGRREKRGFDPQSF